jgi:hypothetical protein
MKLPLVYRTIATSLAIFGAAAAFAQNATLSSDTTTLAPSGGTVTLTATTSYSDNPGALAWSIAIPADWSLVSVTGPNVPAIAPEAGSTGTLEFAFTSVPAQRAEFIVEVRYPANARNASATPTVLVRSGGKLSTLTPPAIELRAAAGGSTQRSRN